MKTRYDVVITGAGPSGLACATELCRKGLDVALLDEQARPGGQIYRNLGGASNAQRNVLGKDYSAGLSLLKAFDKSQLDYLPSTRVWQAEPTGDIFWSGNGAGGKFTAKYLVLGTGAMERPVPFEGWTLPGVMTCGGISNLFKDSGYYPSNPLVMAGSGPLFWLVAKHLLDLKAPIQAILNTGTGGLPLDAAKHLPKALMRPVYLSKGVALMGAAKLAAMKAKVPVYNKVTHLAAHGEDALFRVTAQSKDKPLEFDVATLLVHEGVIPNTALLRQAGCRHTSNPVQRYWHPKTDVDGRTSQDRIFIPGDGAFVHGGEPARIKGQLAALAIEREMRCFTQTEYEHQAAPLRQALAKELRPRPFVDAMYRPATALYQVPDHTIVCRCEGVTAGVIRGLVAKGFTDHNEIKSMARCGMGPCQGRMCGSALVEIVAAASNTAPEANRPLRVRPPIKPITLGEMANAQLGGDNEK
jgi:thioredoxin reductase/bacterioferritin-associated ferredoxin